MPNDNNIYHYNVLEYDCNGKTYLSDKIFILNKNKLIDSYGRVDTVGVMKFFLDQFYPGITNVSGFYAIFDDKNMKSITIKWRTPHWKLIRI